MIQEKRASQSAVRARSNADALRRALIVSPSPVDAQRMASELRRGGAPVDFERVEDRRAMQRALDGGAWDLVLCDGATSSFGATDALALLRASKLDPAFVVVGEACDEALAEEAMRAGASDFVPRERLAGLASVVRRALRHHEECAARRCAEAGWRASGGCGASSKPPTTASGWSIPTGSPRSSTRAWGGC